MLLSQEVTRSHHPPPPNDSSSSEDELPPGSQNMMKRPHAKNGTKKDKQNMKTICEKCFTGNYKETVKNSLRGVRGQIQQFQFLTIEATLVTRHFIHVSVHVSAKGTRADPLPDEPWLKCGVPGCKKLNVHALCNNIKLASSDEKIALTFCKRFVR